ncbi:MAG: lipocalin family protein [Bacteroidaceae bacterium]
MKKLFFFLVCSILLLGSMASCKKTVAVKGPQVIAGIIFDATMNNIVVVTNQGDTVSISTMDTDPQKVPGVLLNDSVEVTCVNDSIDGRIYLKATALTITVHSPYYYIQGTWVEPNPIAPKEMQGFTLNQDGTATSINMASLLMKRWNLIDNTLILNYQSIGNGQTFNGADTLNVVKLNADSLVLSKNGTITWKLMRENKE